METSGDYHELNAGAHRKSPKVLSAPAATWYLAFWTNAGQRDIEGSEEEVAKIKNTLDSFILLLCCAIHKNPGVERKPVDENAPDGKSRKVQLSPSISGISLLFNNTLVEDSFRFGQNRLNKRQDDIFTSSSRSVSLEFTWKKLDVTIRFEIHQEYFSISTFVELDTNRKKQTSYSDLDDLNKNLRSIVKYLNSSKPAAETPSQRSGGKSPPPEGSPSEDDWTEHINKYCFHDFWKTYEEDVLSDGSLKAFTSDEIFKNIFADFRGFIASDQAVEFSDRDFFNENKPPKWGQDAKKKFLPLIQHRDRAKDIRYECAVNYMLDGRALYMSTLGPQLPSMPENERIPVEFIIYAHQRHNGATIVNKWQLGRIVNQMLLLGTLRLCALKDVKLLHKASRQLSQLDEYTQAARVAIARAEAKASALRASRLANPKQRRSASSNEAANEIPSAASDNNAALSQELEAMELITKAREKLNDITGNFLRDTGSGLLYRIERSRHYVKQFDESVKLLRIKRVEGDQPYDLFIRRRLGSEFDYIDRLGIRHERATQTIGTLDQNYLAITQNALVEQANQIDEDIHTIQKWGEFVLLAALVPYYVTHLLVLIIGEQDAPLMAVNVWVIFIAIAFVNYNRLLEKFAETKRWKSIFEKSQIWKSRIRKYITKARLIFAGLVIVAALGFLEFILWNFQYQRHERSPPEISREGLKQLKESVDKGTKVLKKLLEEQKRSLDNPKIAPGVRPGVPAEPEPPESFG